MKIKKHFLLSVLLITVTLQAGAQHFYYRLDLSSSNIYAFALSNLATAGLNRAANRMLFDNYYSYTIHDLSSPTRDVNVKNYSPVGITARDAFNDVGGGLRLGYNSFNPGSVNWAVFATAHYKLNQFKTQLTGLDDPVLRHRMHHVAVGAGVMLSLGGIESPSRVILEAGVRYNIPVGYAGPFGTKANDVLNSGISTHYALKFGGFSKLQGLGVWADIPHYNMLKNGGEYLPGGKLKSYSFGIVYTITPSRVKDSYQ